MEHLRQADLRAALDFLELIGGAGDLDEFANRLVAALGEVIPADVVAYNEVNPALQRASLVSDFDIEGNLPGATAILERHMHDNPLVVYTARTRDGSAHTWSEFVTQRGLHATALWDGLFRPFAIERQMVALLPTPAPLLVGVVLNRCGRDFSARDRALLNLLRPHLANAYHNAQARATVGALDLAPPGQRDATIVVGRLGEPVALTPRAGELLAAFGNSDGSRLPDRLLHWCRHAHRRAPLAAEPLVTSSDGVTVEARFRSPEVIHLRVLQERLDPGSMASLPLTRREREVLALVAEGHTNKEIAAHLDVRPATVKKHLERIYDKLGVHTRTAAAATAQHASGSWDPSKYARDSSGWTKL